MDRDYRKHIKELQKFKNNFVHLPHSVTQAILDWDVGMWQMEWRIKERKLNFVRQILLKNDGNIAKRTLQQEIATGLNGLAHKCKNIFNEIYIPEITNNNVLIILTPNEMHSTRCNHRAKQK